MSNSDNKKRLFGLTSFAVDNATVVLLLMFMIVLFGMRSYNTMPKEQFPEISFPTIYVNTPYFGNSAIEIENLVTRPIEKELKSITGIKDIRSTSVQDYSVITAEFEPDLDIEDVKRKVKDAVDIAKSELPNDLTQDPLVQDVNFSEIPIITINLAGQYSNDELRNYAEELQDDLENLDEISEVLLQGAREREVEISVDLLKMQALELSFDDIENAVRMENITMSGGEIKNKGFLRAMRVIGQFDRVEEIEGIIIKSENQKSIYLRDIASVEFGFKDRSSISRSEGDPVISLNVIKRSGQNLLSAADKIKAIVTEAQSGYLPSDLNVSFFNDLSIDTRRSVDNLENSIISGVILVVLVLLFFLGLRNALFVGIAIPLSMLMGILLLSMTGITMNIVVLFGLILALGMLVDNGIVVVENIYRYVQSGEENEDASRYGASEVAWAIISSTATTLAAFVPLAFWPGIMGEFMQYLPITLILVLSSSLFVALVINPVLTKLYMKIDDQAKSQEEYKRKRRNILIGLVIFILIAIVGQISGMLWVRNMFVLVALISAINFFFLRRASFYFQKNILTWLEHIYDRFITFVLRGRNPGWTFLATILLLFFSLVLLGIKSPKVIFFPKADPLYINAFIELPLGTDIEKTNTTVLGIEQQINEVLEPYRPIVEAVLTQIGENTADPSSPPEPGLTPNKARITVSFVAAEKRGDMSTKRIMEDIRSVVKSKPGVKIIVDQNADGPPTGKPINLELTGEHIEELVQLSQDVINYINSLNIPGIEELQADVKLGKPELSIHIDRQTARRYELSTMSIANAIRTSVFGREISKFKQGEDEYDIYLRASQDMRNNVADLLNQKITFRDPTSGKIVQVPISAVARAEYSSTYSSIKRKNLDRSVTIFSNVLDGYNANEIVDRIKADLAQYDFPAAVGYEFTGEQEEQAENMEFLSSAFLVAVFAIFIILVAQFNSIVTPFIIILSILFSTIGVFLGYSFTGRDIVIVFTGVGIISLAGIVVNNAIVLIDYIDLMITQTRKERGVSSIWKMDPRDVRSSIQRAGAIRLRPVLLTAITTILGLIPLAVGLNFNFFTLISDLDPQFFIGGDNAAIWGPMAWTVIYGLTFSTFLTLVVIPTMYWLFYAVLRWTKELLGSSS